MAHHRCAISIPDTNGALVDGAIFNHVLWITNDALVDDAPLVCILECATKVLCGASLV